MRFVADHGDSHRHLDILMIVVHIVDTSLTFHDDSLVSDHVSLRQPYGDIVGTA